MADLRLASGRILVGIMAGGALALPFIGGFPLAYALILASLMLVAWWLASGPRRAELGGPADVMMVVATAFIALAFAITAREPTDLGYVGNFAMLAGFPLLRAAAARLAGPEALRWVAIAALTGAAIATITTALEVAAGGSLRAQGFGSDPIWAAQAALLTGFLAVIGFGAIERSWRYLFLFGPAFGIFAVLLTGSRGPLLAVIPLLAVAVALSPGRRLAITAGLVGAIGIAIIAALALQASMLARVSSMVAASDSSSEIRLMLYRAGAAAFFDSPLAGYGWQQRTDAAYAQVPGGEEAIVALDPMMVGSRHLHADIVDLGVGAGALGLLAYALFLAAPVVGALAAPRDSQWRGRLLGATILAVSYLFCGLTYAMLGYEFPTTLYAVIAALLLGWCRDIPAARATGVGTAPAPTG